MLQIDLHRTTLCRWEIVFHAAVLAARRSWYCGMEQALLRPAHDHVGHHGPRPTVFRFSSHTIRGDATNSAIWGKSKDKLHSAEVQSRYLLLDVEQVEPESHAVDPRTTAEFLDNVEFRGVED